MKDRYCSYMNHLDFKNMYNLRKIHITTCGLIVSVPIHVSNSQESICTHSLTSISVIKLFLRAMEYHGLPR